MEHLPLAGSDLVLDLGCGMGEVTRLLAQRARSVIGIDLNEELLNFARKENKLSNVEYLSADERDLSSLKLPIADGIWSSFAAAYFPNLTPILQGWLSCLKPSGWIAVVEINDLFAHIPVEPWIQTTFKAYYQRQRDNNVYDFEMGRKLEPFLAAAGCQIKFEANKTDQELAFSGPADQAVIEAWENRLNRMVALQTFFGKQAFAKAKQQFLAALASKTHQSNAEIRFLIARKQTLASP